MKKKLLLFGAAGLIWPLFGVVLWLFLAYTGCMVLPWDFPGRSWMTNSYSSLCLVTFSGTFVFWIAAPLYLLINRKLNR